MSNHTNTSDLALINQQSIQLMQSQALGYICFLISGFFATIFNVLIFLTILRSKSLHTKYFATLASLSIGGLLCGILYFYHGCKKTYLTYSRLPETSTQMSCLIQYGPLLWSTGLSDWLTLALNVDRFLALAFPIMYKQKLSKAYVIILNGISWLEPTIFWGFGFKLENPQKLVPVCLGNTAPDKWFYSLFTNIRWLAAMPSLLLFSTTLTILKVRLNRTKSMAASERLAARKSMDLGMIKTMGVILGAFIILKIGGYIAMTVASIVLGGSVQTTVIAFAGSMPAMYAASHFTVYMAMSREFRRAFLSAVIRKKVAPNGISTIKQVTVARS